MGQLTDAAKIEAYLGVTAALATKVVRRCRLAELYLRNLKGDAWYDGLLVLQGTDPDDQGVLDAEEVEAYLAFYYALPHLNLRLDADGGVLVQEWTDVAAGTRLQKVFASGRRLEDVRADLLSQAKCLVMGDVTTEYDDAESTILSAVGDVSPQSGLFVSSVCGE